MLEYIYNILGLDQSLYHVPDEVIFVITALFVIFVIGEMFNIVRSLFHYIFGGK